MSTSEDQQTVSSPSPLSSDEEDSFTCEEAIEKMKFGKFQWKLLFLCGGVQATDAMEMMLLSFLAPAVRCEWNLSPWMESLLTSVVFVGMFFGTNFFGVVSDRVGRRKAYLYSTLVTFVAGVLSAFSPNIYVLLVFRGFVGFGIGGAHVGIALFTELCPNKRRGKALVAVESFWTVGTLFEAGLAWFLMPRGGWRYLLLASSVPLFILLLFYPMLPESPRFLTIHGLHDQATLVLERLAVENKRPMLVGKLFPSPPVPRARALDIFRAGMWKITVPLLYCWFSNGFTYYGMVLLTTKILQDAEGEDDCSFPTSFYVEIIITTFAEVPGIIISLFGIDTIGRRLTQALEFLMCSVFIFVLLITVTVEEKTACLFGSRAMITGTFLTIFIFTPEMMPTILRSTGLGAGSSAARLGGILSPFVAAVLYHENHDYPLYVFGTVAFFGSLSILALPFDSKGRSLSDDVTHNMEGIKHTQKETPVKLPNERVDGVTDLTPLQRV